MANWFSGGGFMGGLGDRLLGGRGLPSGNPYTGGTGGAYGRGGGSTFGGYGGGEGSLNFDNRYLAARGSGGVGPTLGTQPVGPRPMPRDGGGPTLSTQPVGRGWGLARPTGRGF